MSISSMTGIPGSNPSGSQNVIPGVGGGTTPAVGGSQNPLGAPVPAGTSMPNTSNPLAGLIGLNPAGPGAQTGTSAQGGNIAGLDTNSIVKAFRKAGFSSGDAYLIAQFLEGGAGFNPQVAQAMLASLQPGIERGQANILEQFGAEGLRNSSPAAIGLGDFMSQVTLDEGQILSQMYEQAVQNYMEVILAGRRPPSNSMAGIGSIMGGAGQAASGLSQLLPTLIPSLAA